MSSDTNIVRVLTAEDMAATPPDAPQLRDLNVSSLRATTVVAFAEYLVRQGVTASQLRRVTREADRLNALLEVFDAPLLGATPPSEPTIFGLVSVLDRHGITEAHAGALAGDPERLDDLVSVFRAADEDLQPVLFD